MPDSQNNPAKPLSEIGHLFLSSVRDKQTSGMQRPVRTPPGAVPPVQASVDLTPEEYAGVFGAPEASARALPVSVILAGHLGGTASDRTREYARHVAHDIGRVGLMELDGADFRLSCIEKNIGTTVIENSLPIDASDARHMQEAIEELNWDVTRWLIAVPNPRTPEARAILRLVDQWVLLCTGDHDGVVSCYRTLKGLSDIHTVTPGAQAGQVHTPRLSLAVLDALDLSQARRLTKKLAGVCDQFLSWPLDEHAVAIRPARDVSEHLLLSCRPTRDKGQIAQAAHWRIVTDMLTQMKVATEASPKSDATPVNSTGNTINDPNAFAPRAPGLLDATDPTDDAAVAHVADLVVAPHDANEPTVVHRADEVDAEPHHPANFNASPASGRAAPYPLNGHVAPAQMSQDDIHIGAMPKAFVRNSAPEPLAQVSAPMMITQAPLSDLTDDVLDLPTGGTTEAGIISAVICRSGHLITCPVKPPACPDAELVVGRDRTLTMLAVAKSGLADLRAIGKAWQWLNENRQLIALAVPQLSIDAHALPKLQLLIDHTDASADLLQPLLAAGHVTVLAYRTLKWGGKTGLLLQAA